MPSWRNRMIIYISIIFICIGSATAACPEGMLDCCGKCYDPGSENCVKFVGEDCNFSKLMPLAKESVSEAPVPKDHSIESDEENIFNLIEDGKIKVEAEGSGISSLQLKIEPTVDLNIDVSIPAGTFFPANKGSTQNMISTKGITVKLEVEPGLDIEVDVPVACTNMHKAVPESSDVFEIERSSNNPELMKLLPVLESEDANYPVKQAAIWIVTDNADYGDLGTLTCENGERVISGSEASEAMRLIPKAGIDITNKAIWKDQDLIEENIRKPSCYKEEAVVTITQPGSTTICEKCPAGYQGPDANCKCWKCAECPAGYQGPDANCECWKWVYE